MALSNETKIGEFPRGTILSAASIQKAQDVLNEKYETLVNAPSLSSGGAAGLYPPKEPAKPSQPFSEGAQAYLYGVLAAMSAGVCKLDTMYAALEPRSYETKLVAEFKTNSGGTVLIPIRFPGTGTIISDDWFTEMRARISMECGE